MAIFFLLLGILLVAGLVIARLLLVIKAEASPLAESRSAVVSAPVDIFVGKGASQGQGTSSEKETLAHLEEGIRSAQEKAEVQARDAQETIDRLQKDNERLQKEVVRLTGEGAAFRVDEETLQHLRAENAAFKEQLDSSHQEVQRLSDEIEGLRVSFEDQLARAGEAKDRLEEENAQLKLAGQSLRDQGKVLEDLRAEHAGKMEALGREIGSLRRDNEDLKAAQEVQSEKIAAQALMDNGAVDGIKKDLDKIREERASLEKRVEELEQANVAIETKNRLLQYELTKDRAQAVGLERISEGVRKRFEDMAREARSAGEEKVALERQNTLLQKSLEDLKKLNSEMARRSSMAVPDQG
ncbi:MAG: hypothetical protein GX606_06920 [Elusimicrobia bacterium]|nr:hypothetical protein [Elusimicrobiota bacterium]